MQNASLRTFLRVPDFLALATLAIAGSGSVLGLGRERGALWTARLDAGQIRVLAAPDRVAHMPYLLAMALLGIFVLTLRTAKEPA